MKVRFPSQVERACPDRAPLRGRSPRGLLAASAAALVALAPALGYAQFPGGPGGPGGGFGGPPQGQSPPPKQEGPETHAASGADETNKLQTSEPSLPEDPLALPQSAAKRIGTDFDPSTVEQGREAEVKRRFYGLWYSEESGKYRFRTLFPLWAERDMNGDRASLYTPFYYNRRSKDHDADILFPFFWRFRNFGTTTTIVGPYGHVEKKGTETTPSAQYNWLAPFFFQGKRDNDSGFFHIPPLLTFTQYNKKGGLNVAGPLFCKWRGGSVCDPRTADAIDLGVAPFYFFGRDEYSEYEIFPPLLHYYSYSEQGDSSLDVWGPYVRRHNREKDSTWLLPFYYHFWGKNEDSLTLFPFYHKSHSGARQKTLATPLFVDHTSEDGASTFVTWGYARHRGRTELDMITPFYWEYRDPDIQLKRQILFPFYYRNQSPRSDDLALFPFYGRFEQKGLSTTTFVTPLFRYTKDLAGWEADLFPFIYVGREHQSSHTVLAPFFWDFVSPKSRTTIALPVFFRFEDEESITQLALNTFYKEKKGTGDWQFHFFPFVDFGATRKGHYWNLLYGLAGFEREGTKARMKAFYFPITLSE